VSGPRYVIREAAGSPVESLILGLQYLCLPQDAPLPIGGHFWWLAWREDYPVAFAALTVHEYDDFQFGHLSRAGVLPDHRGNGLQRRLIGVREKKAKALGLPLVISTTYNNAPSGNNLISCGYRLYTPADPWMAEGTNYWTKKLSP